MSGLPMHALRRLDPETMTVFFRDDSIALVELLRAPDDLDRLLEGFKGTSRAATARGETPRPLLTLADGVGPDEMRHSQ